MLTTLAAERYDGIIDPNLAGWAGDLQSFIRDLKLVTYGLNLSENELKDKAYDIITDYASYNTYFSDPKFPREDFISDLDAKNIHNMDYQSQYLSELLNFYYCKQYKSRVDDFIINMGGRKSLKEKIIEYTRGDGVIKHMILHHFANNAADRDRIKMIYIDSIDTIETGAGVDSPIYITESLPHPSEVTIEESNALEYVFEKLIGLNEEDT